MPELRRGVRRGRAAVALQQQQPQQQQQQKEKDQKKKPKQQNRKRNCVKTGNAVAGQVPGAREGPWTRLAARRLKQEDEVIVKEEEVIVREDQVVLISERDSDDKKKGQKVEKEEKGIGMGDDSGGLSANKAAGQEEEGNTAPFPERVYLFVCCFYCIFCSFNLACWFAYICCFLGRMLL